MKTREGGAVEGRTLTERKRADILRAAAEAFRHEGFRGSSTDRIAERAGVSKRTLYNHFPSKDALFDAVLEGYWARLAPLAETPDDDELSVEARLAALARARLEVLLDPEVLGFFRAVLGESMRTPELARAWQQNASGVELLGFRTLIDHEVARGRLFAEDTQLASEQLWGLVFESLFWPSVILLRGRVSVAERERVIREGLRTFLARYGVPPQGALRSTPTAHKKTAKGARK